MRKLSYVVFTVLALLLIWQGVIFFAQLPNYILPSPARVFSTLIRHYPTLLEQAGVTLLEIIAGLFAGIFIGILTALLLFYSKTLARFLLPILLTSQAIPVFAIAPLLVLWFGFGFSSKLVMTILIVFFPVASSAFDALKNTPQEMCLLAQSCGATPLQTLLKVRFPAGLPTIAAGIRVAATIAPIGAIIGEWVGASKGLGYVMLVSNARMQTDMLFAALFLLVIMTLTLYFLTDNLLKKLIFWNGY